MSDGFVSREETLESDTEAQRMQAGDDEVVAEGPRVWDISWERLLREARFTEFNDRVAMEGPADLSGATLRMIDLTRADVTGASFRGAQMRASDLRGLDLSQCDMDGATIPSAKVSGARFPDNLDPQEIMMSIEYGTRLRSRNR
ncbi:MAG: pentapeptide repeat-containing protein [Leptospirillia bacterium]